MTKAKDPLDERDGQEPLEEVSATECDSTATKAEVRAGTLDGPPQESQATFADEICEQFSPQEPKIGISPIDGLPIPLDESTQLALAPAFSIENVLCLEDARKFVEVFAEDLRPEEKEALRRMNEPNARVERTLRRLRVSWFVLASVTLLGASYFASTWLVALSVAFAAAMVVSIWTSPKRPDLRFGARSAYGFRGSSRAELSFAPSAVKSRFGVRFARVEPAEKLKPTFDGLDAVIVRPIREACVNYKRQMLANDDQPDTKAPGHKLIFRNCTARRSVGGAYMSIRDEAVYACDYRSPPSKQSAELLAKTDESILQKSANRTLVPLFNLTAKLPKKE